MGEFREICWGLAALLAGGTLAWRLWRDRNDHRDALAVRRRELDIRERELELDRERDREERDY